MKDHFDFLWGDHASIDYSSHLDKHEQGVDQGIRQNGIANILSTPEEGRQRILWMIRNAKKYLYIQGFSLYSYFEPQNRGSLYKALQNRVKAGDITIKILLINPRSQSGVQRSYREYLLNNKKDPLSLQDFFKGEHYKEEKLYRETTHSNRIIEQLEAECKRDGKTPPHVRFYDTAPYCFMLMTEESVLVEQYHYGNQNAFDETDTSALDEDGKLGNDMPRLEYRQSTTDDDTGMNKPNQPYLLLSDHFNFVFDSAQTREEIGL